jgi:hypothetical protein
MGSTSSQPQAELSNEDIEFISSKAKIDHESVKIWYDKLKVRTNKMMFYRTRQVSVQTMFSSLISFVRRHVPMERSPKQIRSVFFEASTVAKKNKYKSKPLIFTKRSMRITMASLVCRHVLRFSYRMFNIFRSTRISHRFCININRQHTRKTEICLSNVRS